MEIAFQYCKYVLDFNFEAGTSRGVMHQKTSWFIKLASRTDSDIYGLGEASPLPGLSIDNVEVLEKCLYDFSKIKFLTLNELKSQLHSDDFGHLPSLKFALETAILDLENEGKRIIYPNDFSLHEKGIPINGLVWMGSKDGMLAQVTEKIQQGYCCIKLKVGAIDFEEEVSLLAHIRSRYTAAEITLRLDANGAWEEDEALTKLKRVAAFDIHSIEQPIKPNQRPKLKRLCMESPIPIALDEELIGIKNDKLQLIVETKPAYLILKPSLLGGFAVCDEWIAIAEANNIGWWLTSALESNIGLNAICQYTASKNIGNFPQGLGTGQLYRNNIESPLTINAGYINYQQSKKWNETTIIFE